MGFDINAAVLVVFPGLVFTFKFVPWVLRLMDDASRPRKNVSRQGSGREFVYARIKYVVNPKN